MLSEKARKKPGPQFKCLHIKKERLHRGALVLRHTASFLFNDILLLLLLLKGIFVTRVQPEGPASKLLQPGDKIIQVTKIHLFIIFFIFHFITNLPPHQEIIKCHFMKIPFCSR